MLGKYTFFPPEAELYKLYIGAWETVKGANNFQYAANEDTQNPDEDTQALVNGAIHWIGYNKIHLVTESLASHEFVIVLFHICHEEFRVMKLSDYLSRLNLVEGLYKSQ